jgi:hypothetical protein
MIHKENPTRCNNILIFFIIPYLYEAQHVLGDTAHHQEPKTALAAFGFSYVRGCWTCRWRTLLGTVCLTTSTICTGSLWFFIREGLLDVQMVAAVRHSVPDNVHHLHWQPLVFHT